MNGFRCSRWHCDGMALLLILLSTSFWSTAVHAQTLLIKLVNGRSGRPISDSFVNVWVGNAQKAAMPIPTDQEGIARLRLTDKDSEIDVHNRLGVGVKNPVVKYSDSLRVNAGYVSCQPNKPDYSWLLIQSVFDGRRASVRGGHSEFVWEGKGISTTRRVDHVC